MTEHVVMLPGNVRHALHRADYSIFFVSITTACTQRTGAAICESLWQDRPAGAGSRRRLRSTLAAAPVLFAHAHTQLLE
jgi:hypothetical protein